MNYQTLYSPVKHFVVLLTFLIGLCSVSSALEMNVVSPGGLENSEGTSNQRTLTFPFRAQTLYPASDFDSLPDGGAWITHTAIRADKIQPVEVTNTFADTLFTLSTTSLTSLTLNFDDNLGGDKMTVFDGSTSLTYPVSGPTDGPNPFGDRVKFQTPFFYDPSLGNLLVEQVSTSGNDIVGSHKDWQGTTGNIGYVNGFDPQGTIAGFSEVRVVVTQFTFVPEPSTMVLTALACAGLLILSPKFSRSVV